MRQDSNIFYCINAPCMKNIADPVSTELEDSLRTEIREWGIPEERLPELVDFVKSGLARMVASQAPLPTWKIESDVMM